MMWVLHSQGTFHADQLHWVGLECQGGVHTLQRNQWNTSAAC